jgi:hypothetical protein
MTITNKNSNRVFSIKNLFFYNLQLWITVFSLTLKKKFFSLNKLFRFIFKSYRYVDYESRECSPDRNHYYRYYRPRFDLFTFLISNVTKKNSFRTAFPIVADRLQQVDCSYFTHTFSMVLNGNPFSLLKLSGML